MKPRISTQSSGLVWLNPWQKGFFRNACFAVLFVIGFMNQATAQLNVSISYTAPACPGFGSGLATAQVTGGTGPYNFYWSNGQSGQTISNPAAGGLSVTVTDAAYSSASNSTNVVIPAPIELTVAGASDPCAPGSNYLQATVTGGTAPYGYAWSNGGSGPTITGLSQAGFYFATVTDANGCIKVGGAAYSPSVSVNIETHPSKCGGTCDGSIEAKVTGGTQPFSFSWNNGPTPNLQQQAPAPEGYYTITVTDGTGCTAVASGILDDPDPISVNLAYSVPCASPTNITAAAAGGTPPYNYQWGYGQGGPTAYNLQTGTWVLIVTDAHGCAKEAWATVSPSDLVVNTATTAAGCLGQGGGTASVNPSGGSGTYTYEWSNGETTATATNLVAGQYTVTVYDGTGCHKTATVEVDEAVSFTTQTQTTPYRCDGAGGSATVTISGSSSNYTFAWNDPDHQTSAVATDLDPGQYEVTVTSADGCSDIVAIEIEDGSMQVAVSMQPANCDDNGSAQLSVSNHSGSLTYEWSNGNSGNSSAGLAPGAYTVTVTDADGCKETLQVQVPDESFSISMQVVEAICPGATDGVVQAVINGGNSNTNYTYQWNNWAQSNTIGGLSAGTYTVTVNDQAGCEQVASIELESSPEIDALLQVVNAPCTNLANGNIEVTINGGAAPFAYQWSTGSTTPQAPSLAAGAYTVTITDANGCTRSLDFQLDNQDMEIALNLTEPTCVNIPDGNAVVAISGGGAAPFTYQWSTGATDASLTDLAAGSYSVIVTDAFGCQAQESFVVEPQYEVDADFAWAALDCDGSGVTVQFTGQSANADNWQWSLGNGQTLTGANPQILVSQSPMTIELTVTSPQGCVATASQTIEAAPISLALESMITACEGQDVELNLTVDNPSGGTLTYDWMPANLVVSGQGTPNPVFAPNTAGQYNVSVSVSNGTCTVNDEAVVDVTETITIDPAAIFHSQCQDLEVNFTNTSGMSGTWYFEYPNQTFLSNEINPSFIYGAPGNYNVSFIPDGQCAEPVYLVLGVSEAPAISFEVSAADCNDPITVVFSNTSNIPVTGFQWDFGALGTSTEENPVLTVSGSQVVTAQLTAVFGNGCEQSVFDEVPVESFMPPSLNSQLFACSNGGDVQLNPGGDPSYNYLWSGPGLNDPNAVNPTVTVNGTQTYQIVITASNGCSASQSVTVGLPAEELEIAPMDDILACDFDPVTLVAQSNQPNVTYTWSNDSDFDFTIGTEQALEVQTGNQPITYYVMGTNPNGCTAMTSVTVQNAAVDVDFDNAFEVCKGEQLELNVDLDGITVDDFTNWEPFNPLTAPLFENRTFTFQVTNALGCTGMGELTIKVVEFTGTLDITAEPAEVWAGQTTQLHVTENANYEYLWSPVLGLSDPFGPNPEVSPEGTTTYTVEVTDIATGCRSSRDIEVKVKDIICEEPYIFIPNAFTPNGDGVNDVLKVEGFNIEELYLAIYDRWGEKVYETSSKEEGWDGTFRGSVVSGDVYGYYVKVRCPGGLEFFKKGNITVLR